MTEMLFDFASKLRSKEGGEKKKKVTVRRDGRACHMYVRAHVEGRA